MRVGFICRDPGHASSRVRALQFLEPLRSLGIEVKILTWRPSASRDVVTLTARAVALGRWADVVVAIKPRMHPRALGLLRSVQPRLVVDVDDAVWTWPAPFPERFDVAARRARLIMAGSSFLRERLEARYPAAHVVLVPTTVDLDRYPARPDQESTDPVTVGWLGGSASLDDFTEPVLRSLRRLVEEGVIQVKIVCSRGLDPTLLPTTFEPWSMATEAASLHSFDIGIMPLRDDEQSRGRCGLKALQYMAVGLAVVASPVGAATEIIEDGISGSLAESEKEWTAALRALAKSHEERARLGVAARERVADNYSVRSTVETLATTLRSVAAA